MASRARPRGWHLQFYSPGTVVRDLLPFLGDLEDRFVVDHMGYMVEADGLTDADFDRLLDVLALGNCWIKLSGPYRIAKSKPLSSVEPIGRALVAARPDRLIWGSDWPHLPDGQRDTGELLNLLPDWAPSARDRRRILVESPDVLFFAD
jgi:predicted TIM-barrel fold metal-dependent hydrolase